MHGLLAGLNKKKEAQPLQAALLTTNISIFVQKMHSQIKNIFCEPKLCTLRMLLELYFCKTVCYSVCSTPYGHTWRLRVAFVLSPWLLDGCGVNSCQ